MQPGGRLSREARKQMLISLIAGGIFIFAFAAYTVVQVMSENENPTSSSGTSTP